MHIVGVRFSPARNYKLLNLILVINFMSQTILGFMMEDHHRLDGIFGKMEAAKNALNAKKYFIEFNYGLRRHIVWEEKIFFPIFEKKKGLEKGGPTEAMRADHKEIKKLLERIHDCVASEDSKEFEKIKKFEKDFRNLISAHNFKEEQMLYGWIDDMLDDKEREKVFKEMANVPAEEYEKCCE